MLEAHRVVIPLRVFLVLPFGVLVVFQTMSLPGQFAYVAQEDPEHAHLRWPATVVTVFWVLCIHMLVMRALLRQATTLRTDMEAVI